MAIVLKIFNFISCNRLWLFSAALIITGLLACLKLIDLSLTTGILYIVIGIIYYVVESVQKRKKAVKE